VQTKAYVNAHDRATRRCRRIAPSAPPPASSALDGHVTSPTGHDTFMAIPQ
jgi:hypothetical protein